MLPERCRIGKGVKLTPVLGAVHAFSPGIGIWSFYDCGNWMGNVVSGKTAVVKSFLSQTFQAYSQSPHPLQE